MTKYRACRPPTSRRKARNASMIWVWWFVSAQYPFHSLSTHSIPVALVALLFVDETAGAVEVVFLGGIVAVAASKGWVRSFGSSESVVYNGEEAALFVKK